MFKSAAAVSLTTNFLVRRMSEMCANWSGGRCEERGRGWRRGERREAKKSDPVDFIY